MIEIRKQDETLSKILPKVKPRPGISYVPSRYALSFGYRGKNYVFNNLTKQFIEDVLPEKAGAGEGYDHLIESLFLVPAGKDECAYYNSISALIRAFKRPKGVNGYTILPTYACNARCVYCYEEGIKPTSMTPEVAEQTVRYIVSSQNGNKISLNWFGGEPLLRPDIIDRICAGVRKAGIAYKSSMITNGSLITPEIIGKMTGEWNLKNVQVSMDGAESDYKKRKNYYDYKDYYKAVMNSLSRLSEAGIRVTVRCNVDPGNRDGIPAYLEDMKNGVENKDGVSVYFAPLNDVRQGDGDLEMWEEIRKVRPLTEAAGFRSSPFIGLGLGFRVTHCMADAGSVVITPDGSLYPCEHCPPESRFGDVWNGVTDEAAKKEFCRVDVTREKCRECPFLPDCTSFASCPVQDSQCREVREMMATEALKRMIDKKTESENANGENPIC